MKSLKVIVACLLASSLLIEMIEASSAEEEGEEVPKQQVLIVCKTGDVKASNDYCNVYERCDKGSRWVKEFCPFATYFDNSTNTCVYYTKVERSCPKPLKLFLKQGDTFVGEGHLKLCDKFLEMTACGYKYRSCPQYHSFNPDKKECVTGGTCKHPIYPGQISNCSELGEIFAVKPHCNAFIFCLGRNTEVPFICPANYYFNEQVNSCVELPYKGKTTICGISNLYIENASAKNSNSIEEWENNNYYIERLNATSFMFCLKPFVCTDNTCAATPVANTTKDAPCWIVDCPVLTNTGIDVAVAPPEHLPKNICDGNKEIN